MQPTSKRSLISWWTITSSWLLLLPTLAQQQPMDSLSTTFTIEVDGRPIANVAEGAEDRTQAQVGSEAAVFTFKEGRLHCGDWVLGRNTTENRSFLPKKVLWFKSENQDGQPTVQPVTLQPEGESYQVKFNEAPLIVENDQVFADIQGGRESTVLVKLQD